MLIIRKEDGFSILQLDRVINKAGAHGVWEYHSSACSSMFPGHQVGRHVRWCRQSRRVASRSRRSSCSDQARRNRNGSP